MNESWRPTYTFTYPELIETLRSMRRGTYVSNTGWLERREVYLQAQERGFIGLPVGVNACDAHTVPFSSLTILHEPINTDEEKR